MQQVDIAGIETGISVSYLPLQFKAHNIGNIGEKRKKYRRI